ncbi:MAG: fumarylacetoacetate hydrolase family protein [Phycisphaeraceae bacterium]|nr:fumarylacetoacetate hydrolase family protein [Phycisphaeraceae bacterium]
METQGVRIPIVRMSDGVAFEVPGSGLLPLRHIIGIGRNYAEHAKEQAADVPDRPMVFTKNIMAACLNGDEIVVPKVCQDRDQVDWEAELAVVIGRAARDVSVERAISHVLGYCCANDVSARWWQKEGSGGQFCRGKSFDTFCPMGPFIVPAASVPDPQGLAVRCRVNGELMQDGHTRDMIFSVSRLVSDLSQGTTLLPGTVILTGTPSGVGMARKPPVWLRDGDSVEVEIEGIGMLRNRVVFER